MSGVDRLSLLVIGAHPDDPEWYAGGLAAYYVAAGHTVRFLALTNGDAGHYQMRGEALASRRYGESQAAGKVLGVAEYAILSNHDGTLTASFEARLQVVAAIRRAAPDLIVCHRRWDYHPDHRAAGELVEDATSNAMTATILPDVPPIGRRPVVVYAWDQFQKPYPFRADVVLDVDAVGDLKLGALACHVSQFLEPRPGSGAPVPADEVGRMAWLRHAVDHELLRWAHLYRERLVDAYGRERGTAVAYAEPFEHCEYGAPLTEGSRRRLFWMVAP